MNRRAVLCLIGNSLGFGAATAALSACGDNLLGECDPALPNGDCPVELEPAGEIDASAGLNQYDLFDALYEGARPDNAKFAFKVWNPAADKFDYPPEQDFDKSDPQRWLYWFGEGEVVAFYQL